MPNWSSANSAGLSDRRKTLLPMIDLRGFFVVSAMTYGAAASVVVLLIWVYYTAQIVLFGAELTHAYAAVRGSRRSVGANAASAHSADEAGS